MFGFSANSLFHKLNYLSVKIDIHKCLSRSVYIYPYVHVVWKIFLVFGRDSGNVNFSVF